MKYFASNHALTIQYLQTTVQTLRHDEQSLEDAFVQVSSFVFCLAVCRELRNSRSYLCWGDSEERRETRRETVKYEGSREVKCRSAVVSRQKQRDL